MTVATNKPKWVIAMAALLATLAIGGALAQTMAPSTSTDRTRAMMRREKPHGGMMSGMMMNGEMQHKMIRMMDSCTRLMDSMTPSKGATSGQKG